MVYPVKIREGFRELITGQLLEPPTEEYETYPWPLTLKAGATSFNPMGLTHPIDWGDGSPVSMSHDGSARAISAAGPITVTIFIRKAISSGPFTRTDFWSSSTIEGILNQVDIMHAPLPFWIGSNSYSGASGSGNLVLTNPDFTVLDGFTQNIDWIPTFQGSAIKVGFKVWQDISEMMYFPPYQSWGGFTSTRVWAPFTNCPNIETIDNQGTLGDRLEILSATDLKFYNESGFLKLDAYPSGGAPIYRDRFIYIEDYHWEWGARWPQHDMSRLEQDNNGVQIDNFYIGHLSDDIVQNPENFTNPTLPIDHDFRKAPKLKHYTEGIKKVHLKPLPDFDDFSWAFGLKMLGRMLPPNVEKVRGPLFKMWGKKGDGLEEVATLLNAEILGDLINTTSLYVALGLYYDTTLEPLGPPPVPSTLNEVSDYYSVEWNVTNELYNHKALMELNGDGFYTAIQIQPLPEGVKIVDGYCRDLYYNSPIGVVVAGMHAIENDDGSTTYFPQPALNNPFIPKLPSTVTVVADYLRGTFRGTRGKTETHELPGKPPIYVLESGGATGKLTLYTGITEEMLDQPEATPGSPLPWSLSQYHKLNPTVGTLMRASHASGETLEYDTSYETYHFATGVTIEEGPLPNLTHAIRWQQDCWHDSWVDPTSELKAIIPFPDGVKTEYPYFGALNVKAWDMPQQANYFPHEPLQPGVPTIYGQAFAQPMSEELVCPAPGPGAFTAEFNVPGRFFIIYEKTNTKGTEKIHYDINEVNGIEGLYKLNSVDNIYLAFNKLFSGYFKGSSLQFFLDHGVDQTTLTDTQEERVDYLASANPDRAKDSVVLLNWWDEAYWPGRFSPNGCPHPNGHAASTYQLPQPIPNVGSLGPLEPSYQDRKLNPGALLPAYWDQPFAAHDLSTNTLVATFQAERPVTFVDEFIT